MVSLSSKSPACREGDKAGVCLQHQMSASNLAAVRAGVAASATDQTVKSELDLLAYDWTASRRSCLNPQQVCGWPLQTAHALQPLSDSRETRSGGEGDPNATCSQAVKKQSFLSI